MNSPRIPSPLEVLRSVALGGLPRLVQARGWVLAALPLAPVAATFSILLALRAGGHDVPSDLALSLFHKVLAAFMVPILALVAAPAGIREELEQKTLPLLLTRPVAAWMLPFAKGLPWFLWGALWLTVSVAALVPLGADPGDAPRLALALALLFWAELALLALLGLIFKRGALWGALYLFLWDPLVPILPGNLQRFTLTHYVQSLAGSRATDIKGQDLLAQSQILTPAWVAVLVLLAFGALCWIASGWKLHRTPIGLAGTEAEG